MSSTRNLGVDSIRGTAILIMLIANSTPVIFNDIGLGVIPRYLFSLAAPIFIFLSGYSFQLTLDNGKPLKAIVRRAFQVLVIAIIIDILVWQIYPFQTYDVLYLISVSFFIMIFLNLFRFNFKWILFFAIIGGSIMFPNIFKYRFENPDYLIDWKSPSLSVWDLRSCFQRFVFDGWFPVFPWMLMSIMGSFAKSYEKLVFKYKSQLLYFGILLLIISLVVYIQYPGFRNGPREGYLELFYPATGIFWLVIFGTSCIVAYQTTNISLDIPVLCELGKNSLFLYLIHTVMISFVIQGLFKEGVSVELWKRIFILLLYCFILIVIALFLNRRGKTLRTQKRLIPFLYFLGI